MEELKIIKKIQAWEKALFWELYEKYVDEIYKFVYLKTTNVEISQDLVSETFFSALQNIWNFDTDKGYLNTLTKKERDVIIYRIWYDLSFSEISEILGLSLDNCKKISSRTLKKISANFLSFLFIFLIF